jgi:hypothetical protein
MNQNESGSKILMYVYEANLNESVRCAAVGAVVGGRVGEHGFNM